MRLGVVSEDEPLEQNLRDLRMMIEKESWEEEDIVRGNLRWTLCLESLRAVTWGQ